MSRTRWLQVVTRTRQAREDAARADAAQARRVAEVRRQAAAVVNTHIDRHDRLPEGTAAAFVGVAAAQAAAARTLTVAVASWREGLADVATADDVLVAAARARRSIERLVERRNAADLAALWRAEQAVLDDVGGRRRPPGHG